MDGISWRHRATREPAAPAHNTKHHRRHFKETATMPDTHNENSGNGLVPYPPPARSGRRTVFSEAKRKDQGKRLLTGAGDDAIYPRPPQVCVRVRVVTARSCVCFSRRVASCDGDETLAVDKTILCCVSNLLHYSIERLTTGNCANEVPQTVLRALGGPMLNTLTRILHAQHRTNEYKQTARLEGEHPSTHTFSPTTN